MRNQIRTSATALLFLLASVGSAAAADNGWMAAQDRLTLSGAQELAIFQSISRQGVKKQTAPTVLVARPASHHQIVGNADKP
jgi:hypothetical protein